MFTSHKFKKLFSLGLIDKKGFIGRSDDDQDLAFEKFFEYMDDNFTETTEHKILKHADSAKGIIFVALAEAIIRKKDLELRSNKGLYANVMKLSDNNFHKTWKFGVRREQNFAFTIYFNISDVKDEKGNKILEKGYSREFLHTLLESSPQLAQEYAQHSVLRVEGKLPWDKIKFIGFRYKSKKENKFIFKYYEL